jgi:hypothetical protein
MTQGEGAMKFIDVSTIAMAVGVVMKLLPVLAAILPLIWWAIKIYETSTVQKLVKRFRRHK